MFPQLALPTQQHRTHWQPSRTKHTEMQSTQHSKAPQRLQSHGLAARVQARPTAFEKGSRLQEDSTEANVDADDNSIH